MSKRLLVVVEICCDNLMEGLWLLTLNGKGSEKSTRYGGGHHTSSFSLFEGQLKQKCESMSQILSKIMIKLMTSSLVRCN